MTPPLLLLLAVATTGQPAAPLPPDVPDATVMAARTYFETMLGFTFDEVEARAFRTGLAAALKVDPEGMKAWLKDTDGELAQFQELDPAHARELRQSFEPQVLASLAEQPKSPLMVVVLNMWRKRNKVVAEGRPPLSRKAADDFLVVVEFAGREAVGWPAFGAEAREKAVARLAKDYPALPPEEQLEITRSSVTLSALREAWGRLTPAEKAGAKAAWRKALAGQTVGDAEIPPPPVATPEETADVPADDALAFGRCQRLLMLNPFR